jgi:hypothetical protein
MRSTGLDSNSPRFIDAFAIGTASTYTLLVGNTGASAGNATVTLYDVTDATGTIVAGGPSQSVTIGTPGQNAALTFAGIAGHRVSLDMTSTIGGLGVCTGVTIVKPNGDPLVSNACVTNQGAFVEPQSLSTDGTYTIRIDPSGSATGAMTLTLYDVPADVTGAIAPGGASQTITTTTPGQNASLTFTGANLQRISLNMTNVTMGGLGTCTAVTIKNPDGSPLVSNSCVTTQGGFIDVQTLTANGTYTIAIDPPGNVTGSMTLTLYDVPADASGTIIAGGGGQSVAISTPGQNASLTFTGANLERISLTMTNVTIGGLGTCTVVTIKKPDGSPLATNNCVTTQGGFIDVQPLTAGGTYTIAIDPPATATGNMTLTLFDVTDATGSMTINGASVPITLSVPGQNANITVAGTSGQSIRIPVTTPGFNVCATVTLLRQDNVTSVASTTSCGSTITLPSTTLPATETYHVVVDPSGSVTGNYTVSAVSP